MRSSCGGCWSRAAWVSERTIQRAVADLGREQRAAVLATVRVETAAGDELQIDLGQKPIAIAGVAVRVFLLVAVLSYSRRLFVKALFNERGDGWREGIAAAFRHFGGVPRVREIPAFGPVVLAVWPPFIARMTLHDACCVPIMRRNISADSSLVNGGGMRVVKPSS
jgi:hypothetical protein